MKRKNENRKKTCETYTLQSKTITNAPGFKFGKYEEMKKVGIIFSDKNKAKIFLDNLNLDEIY